MKLLSILHMKLRRTGKIAVIALLLPISVTAMNGDMEGTCRMAITSCAFAAELGFLALLNHHANKKHAADIQNTGQQYDEESTRLHKSNVKKNASLYVLCAIAFTGYNLGVRYMVQNYFCSSNK